MQLTNMFVSCVENGRRSLSRQNQNCDTVNDMIDALNDRDDRIEIVAGYVKLRPCSTRLIRSPVSRTLGPSPFGSTMSSRTIAQARNGFPLTSQISSASARGRWRGGAVLTCGTVGDE